MILWFRTILVSPLMRRHRAAPLFIVFCAIFLSFASSLSYNELRSYDNYDRNDYQQRQTPIASKPLVYANSYFDMNHTAPEGNNDYQQRQHVRNRFEWNRKEDDRSPRYEWPRSHYTTPRTTTTTTTSRPYQYRHYYDREASRPEPETRYEHTYTVNRGTSHSDGTHVPGPYSWYNRTFHWSDNKTRGYDPDLDGTTLPPEEFNEEEEWDGTDFFRPHIDEQHPLAIYTSGRCDEYQACYPATGNLLIGRENRLNASSTCGLRNKVRYCVVSHLKEKKKCFHCDSREKFKGTARYHGVENIVSRIGKKRKQFWWQAENGVENVYIQFDLEAEFHFTHLIITFKTFRPSAMLIERSHDFGNTWHVYQYFAYDCGQSFPGIPIGPRNRITDVVCDSQYSGVDPSTEGEVIFRVLPPNIRINDPYSKEVQNMLKITNLRINFTQLHNLGDNLLDPRSEIKEKYYYSIYDMVVRGSCSCYGHANRCIPGHDETVPDMVYGQCECTHNTKGRNCELCKDLYNDLEWKPAFGRETNACKMCNCNNHASRCHFDPAVYYASNNVSGGVCDDCQHNTDGNNCERCRQMYYRDPSRSSDDPNVCQQCDCDPRGSEENGLCDEYSDPKIGLEAGKCHCKKFVEGRRCDHCRPGYWNLHEINPDGCEACSCNQLGTVGNLGCNVHTGECVCKRNVVGRDCNECALNYYGLSSDEEGCKACDCDPGGSYSPKCDLTTGQCDCRPHVTGRRCDQPEPGYFVPLLDYLTYEAEEAQPISGQPQVNPRQPFDDRSISWTGKGFMRMHPQSGIQFTTENLPESKLYDVVIRYEPQMPGGFDNVEVAIRRPHGIDPNGPCSNYTFQPDTRRISLPSNQRHVVIDSICLEKNSPYLIDLNVNEFNRPTQDHEAPSILIDSIAITPRPDDISFFSGSPENERRKMEFDRFNCYATYYSLNRSPEPDEYCRKLLMSVGMNVYNGAYPCQCDPTGSTSADCSTLGGHCPCKPHVAERTCNRCHVGYYDFGPDGCKACDCHRYGSLDAFCDPAHGQCNCRTGTFGRQCDECQSGYWNYPNCQRCDCNGFSDTCDSKTGHCTGCAENTAGQHCDECAIGYYGDPLGRYTNVPVPCRQCSCPGVEESGMSHAKTCELDYRSQNVICHCLPGYTGVYCDKCAENYHGDPTIPGGECVECECNNNIDISQPGSCDSKTGNCLRCLYNTAGEHCEVCKPGFYGNALEHTCVQCVCNHLGTDPRSASCNQQTGQCSCLPNVEGISCDRCADNHWNISSTQGCEPCDCDPQGSHSLKCNEIDGQCHCKESFGGRKCNECLPNHWGDPRLAKCHRCECNMAGSLMTQCDKSTGYCVCVPGISGPRCDRCSRGFTGTAPHCTACGECFDNWDMIIEKLKNETFTLLDKARAIKQTGTTGAYTRQFTEIESSLKDVDDILAGQDIDEIDLDRVQQMINDHRQSLNGLQDTLNEYEKNLNDTKSDILNVNFKLQSLQDKSRQLEGDAKKLKEEATTLQEANVEGAYNITKDAQRRSRLAKNQVDQSSNILNESQTRRRNTENLIEQTSGRHNQSYDEYNVELGRIQDEIQRMEHGLYSMNSKVCGGSSTVDKCDPACGGAGCDRCGGASCKDSAVSKAAEALDMAKNSETALNEKNRAVNDELRRINDARIKSDEALNEAKTTYERILKAKNMTTNTATEVSELLTQINAFLDNQAAVPSNIRSLAEQCLNAKIKLEKNQIEELERNINKTISTLTDTDRILRETQASLATSNELKIKAEQAKAEADAIRQKAEAVKKALEEARRAQEEANESRQKVEKDIDRIKEDLQEIERGTGSAKGRSDEATEKIRELNRRLNDLQKKFASNKYNIDVAEKETLIASEQAKLAAQYADDLERKYQQADDKLKSKSQASSSLKNRANKLKADGLKLFTEASNKTKIIEDLDAEIERNEKTLNDLQKVIDDLNNQMKNHLNHIENRSKHYRTCQT